MNRGRHTICRVFVAPHKKVTAARVGPPVVLVEGIRIPGAVEHAVAYIQRQEEHHRTRTFEEEFVEFLQRHNMAFDARYVFG